MWSYFGAEHKTTVFNCTCLLWMCPFNRIGRQLFSCKVVSQTQKHFCDLVCTGTQITLNAISAIIKILQQQCVHAGYINPSKNVLQFKFEGWYISCYWSMKKETGIMEKFDYSSLQWCAICRDYVIMECAVLLNIGQSQKWNVAKCIVFNTEVSISFEDAMCFE